MCPSHAPFPTSSCRLWEEYWGDLDAAPLGFGGNTVQELQWRLSVGGECFAVGPRVVALWIGFNNLNKGEDPAPFTAYILQWARAAWPSSHLILLNVLPTTAVAAETVAATNKEYAQLAAQWGASFSTCGSLIDPADPGAAAGERRSTAGRGMALACTVCPPSIPSIHPSTCACMPQPAPRCPPPFLTWLQTCSRMGNIPQKAATDASSHACACSTRI